MCIYQRSRISMKRPNQRTRNATPITSTNVRVAGRGSSGSPFFVDMPAIYQTNRNELRASRSQVVLKAVTRAVENSKTMSSLHERLTVACPYVRAREYLSEMLSEA